MRDGNGPFFAGWPARSESLRRSSGPEHVGQQDGVGMKRRAFQQVMTAQQAVRSTNTTVRIAPPGAALAGQSQPERRTQRNIKFDAIRVSEVRRSDSKVQNGHTIHDGQ